MELKTALETQVRVEVDFEAHVVHRALGVLKVPAPRASFARRPCENSPASETKMSEPLVALAAVGLGDHKHQATCHKGPSGQHGCRGNFEKGHHVPATDCVQLVDSAIAARGGVVLAGNEGVPFTCGRGCISHWMESKDGRAAMPLTLVKPMDVPMKDLAADEGPVRSRKELNHA
jgi:hypothetical protein